MSKYKRNGPPCRKVSSTGFLPEMLIFVEGLRTEELYLIDWHRRYRDKTRITIDAYRAGPLQLVKRAIETNQKELRDEKRGRGKAHDQIWCIFDRDEHPNFESALDLAKQHGISLAVSNPCIELWFLLHFDDQMAFIHRSDAQDRSKSILHCAKTLDTMALETLADRYDQAKERATRLDRKHHDDGSPPGSNPSSGLWRVIDQIQQV